MIVMNPVALPHFSGLKLLVIPKADNPREIERVGLAVESSEDPGIGADEVQLLRVFPDRIDTAGLGHYDEAASVTDAFERNGRPVRGRTTIPFRFVPDVKQLLEKLTKDGKIPGELAELFTKAAETADFFIPRTVVHRRNLINGKSTYSKSWDIRPQLGEE